ncbi:A24 family peptidase C-terminal domain-containing protein [Thermococcus sp. JdF3]|uniref:A24 family peptidase C-terminal domain-containing protein n=1 Tax=Thermococcus sp. JdF3 TaxID=1638258 RepID=UPI001438820E|nr:A24 family peptidase C-terminal domain-containing protein [Thermococcus sp. JdF3]NJE01613.1 transposase [Thermococcus sp. JdF3]
METVPLILGLLAGVLTSYTDIKTGFIFDNHAFPTLTLIGRLLGWEEEEEEESELPTWLGRIVIPAAEVGVLYYLYRGIQAHDGLLAASGLIGLILGFILGLLLYYIGAWASGDVVVLAAFSALLPLAPAAADVVPPYGTTYPLYPLAVLFNSILAVFPFIFVYSLAVLVLRKRFHALREVFVGGLRTTVEFTLWIVAVITVQAIMGSAGISSPITGILVALVLLPVFMRLHHLGNAAGILSLGYLMYLDPTVALLTSGRVFVLIYLLKVLLSTVRFMRVEVLMEEVPVEELNEWDILGEVIHEINGEVMRDREDGLERIKRTLVSWDPGSLKPRRGRIIASPTAEGLRKEQIEELKRLVEEGRLENSFLRKKSMPFAPALFIGFLMAYFWGDIFWWLVLRVAGL